MTRQLEIPKILEGILAVSFQACCCLGLLSLLRPVCGDVIDSVTIFESEIEQVKGGVPLCVNILWHDLDLDFEASTDVVPSGEVAGG